MALLSRCSEVLMCKLMRLSRSATKLKAHEGFSWCCSSQTYMAYQGNFISHSRIKSSRSCVNIAEGLSMEVKTVLAQALVRRANSHKIRSHRFDGSDRYLQCLRRVNNMAG